MLFAFFGEGEEEGRENPQTLLSVLNGGIYAGSCDLRSDAGQIHETIHSLIHSNWN